jgi:hypothetical protein
MLPDPLHPAVVHFPIALAAIIPLFAALILLAIRSGRTPPLTWAVVVLCGRCWWAPPVAHGAGEDQGASRGGRRSIGGERRPTGCASRLARLAAHIGSGQAPAPGRGPLAISLATLGAAVRTGHSGGLIIAR